MKRMMRGLRGTTMHGPHGLRTRRVRPVGLGAGWGLAAWLVAAWLPAQAQAMEVAPLSEQEARQMVDVLPDASPPQAVHAASQPVVLKLKPEAAGAPADRAMQLADGHPGALALAALALALWGMRRTRRR
jgi:hypothetical protein